MFFAYKKMLGRTDRQTREKMYCQTIRTVRDISRDDRAIIETCSLRTPTDRLKENYSIDVSAYSAAKDRILHGISRGRNGLVQVVVDNFDTDISSQNGVQSTHSLAMLTTQNTNNKPSDTDDTLSIRRIKKLEMKADIEADVPIIDFRGPKKPQMPQNISKRTVLPLRILAQQSILVRRATHFDFEFLDSVTNDYKVPEYAGFNTRMSREENHSLKPGTPVAYSPLIDMVPSDHSTIMTQ